jgi:hypothetical protein
VVLVILTNKTKQTEQKKRLFLFTRGYKKHKTTAQQTKTKKKNGQK